MSIPPNNLQQLVAWIRIFAEDMTGKYADLKKSLRALKTQIEEKESEK